MKVLIWGTGVCARNYLNMGEISPRNIIGFVDSDPKTVEYKNQMLGGGAITYKVYKPEEIRDIKYDYLLICVWEANYIKEIIASCKMLGLTDDRIIFAYDANTVNDKAKKQFPLFFREFGRGYKCITEGIRDDNYAWVVSARTNEDEYGTSLLQKPQFKGYLNDYFRYRTFEFVAEMINDENVIGDVAEVGVARGTFSRFINYAFQNRTLYMFDTFDSFDRDEFLSDDSTANSLEEFYQMYKNIDVQEVLASMPFQNNCIIRKGFFPNTVVGLENNTYAFVSIDVDLEKSIYNALEYFYPRVNRGGVLFVHDYRCRNLAGVKRAVEKYERKFGVMTKIPIADRGGTLVIKK